jgi:tRNA(His) 5'-end guanylyltransferase
MSLAERQESYKSSYDYEIIKKLPIIIQLDGRNFSKITKNLTKPYSYEISRVMHESMLYTLVDVQGCVFAFTIADEVSFVLRNDQTLETEPWLNNKVQQMASSVASAFTLAFYKFAFALDLESELSGDPIFKAHAWAVPNISEAANYLIYRQQEGYKSALRLACLHNMSKQLGYKQAFELIQGKSIEEKTSLLLKHTGINFEEFYCSHFYHGVCAYRAPVLVDMNGEPEAKNKWYVNKSTPSFIDKKDFMFNILLNGRDVIRTET